MVRKTRPGAVRRPSRSRPQRLGSRRWQWIGSGGAHQRLPTRRRSSERERDSRTRGRSATRAWPFPRRGGGHRRRLASRQVRGAADGWVVALQMDGCASSCAWVASPVRSQQRAWVLRTAPIAAGTHPIAAAAACAPALGVRARGSSPPFFSSAASPSAQLRGCEGFSCTVRRVLLAGKVQLYVLVLVLVLQVSTSPCTQL